MKVKIAALFDSDYRCMEEVAEFEAQIRGPDILCHVLKRKEIENYALVETAMHRAMIKRSEISGATLSSTDCRDIINLIFEQLHNDVRANIVGDYMRHHKKQESRLSDTTLVQRAMAVFEPQWAIRERKLDLVGGKDFLTALSRQFHQEVGASLTLAQIVSEMRPSEVPRDLVEIIDSIETFFTS